MVNLNSNYDRLKAGYLFLGIASRTQTFLELNPGVEVMRLGIGNTILPLPPAVIEGLHLGVEKLSRIDTYTGYGDEQGDERLRKAIAERYFQRGVVVDPSEVFVSDGAKPDSANIQSLFAIDNVVAFQDPAYPVYVDTNVIAGRENFVYMPCTQDNGFFPDFPERRADLIYLCSPNNPTGAVATREQLKKFVDYAKAIKSVIIFDSAYEAFIRNPDLPRTIYEVKGAKDCAIEINSFSKAAGFTGVRLGWAVVPYDLMDGRLNEMWNRRQTTFFNGASNIAQEGGLAVLTKQGWAECQKIVDYYMENAGIIKQGVASAGLKVFGGENAPYLWVQTPDKMLSWDFFDKLLREARVVCTPGVGFGPSGEGYVRLSAFGIRENIERAVESIKDNLKIN